MTSTVDHLSDAEQRENHDFVAGLHTVQEFKADYAVERLKQLAHPQGQA